MINASTERENHFEIWKIGQRAGLLLPDERILDALIGFATFSHDIALRRVCLKAVDPNSRIPVGQRQKDFFVRCRHCLIPPSVASMWKAAAINALV